MLAPTAITARSENQPYICLRPFLVGEISGDVGAKTSQCGSKEKIDAVEAVKARTRSRQICSTK